MRENRWVREFPAAITVTDSTGTIIELNEKAVRTFERDGGAALIGKNLLDCHPEPAHSIVLDLLKTHATNCYTIEKNGIWKMIFQSPWFEGEDFKGLVEISMEIPPVLPHFRRDP